jgi:hypothetical protein
MKRVLLVASLVLVAALAFPVLGSAGAVTLRHIGDPFNGSTLDPNVWLPWGTNQPGLVTFEEGGGVLTANVLADAQPDIVVSASTRCLAHGDFDARVDFNLVNWPPQNGTTVSLAVEGTPYNVYRVSWQLSPSEAYGTFLPPVQALASATGTTGTLRLTRTGDVFTAYYLSGLDWVPLASGTGPTDDVPLGIGVDNISAASPFAGLPVTVDFDNFKVNAQQIVCP